MRFEGIYTPVVTPHNDDLSINKKAFGEAVEHLIGCGPPRRPLQPLNKDDKRELAQVIGTMNTAISGIEKDA